MIDTAGPRPLLRLEGIAKRFGDFTALHPLDLDIERGEFLTLLGPSGCGKTTLLRILAGFERPTDGTIHLDGRDLGARPPEARPFNMVFQSYALFPHMTVGENVGYGLRTTGVSRADVSVRVQRALALVGLEDRADQRVDRLSGGQQQRVALMRALVNEPEVLLLDEPLGALDLQLRRLLQEELRDIQRRLRTTFVYVTHDQEEALSLSHRIALLQDGRVVQVDTPRDIYERPRTRFAAEFVGEANVVPCRVVDSRGHDATVVVAGGHRATFSHHGAEPLSPGSPALVALRPEHLTLTPTTADAHLRGTHDATVFGGADSRHEVRMKDGVRLRVRASGGWNPSPGEDVGVVVAPGRGVVVRAEESTLEPGT